jgi:heterogeneous nuclear ribonucleoprotein G
LFLSFACSISCQKGDRFAQFLYDIEREMAGKEENRIFVGGLSWDITERQLENAFDRFGKIVESQVRYCFFFS